MSALSKLYRIHCFYSPVSSFALSPLFLFIRMGSWYFLAKELRTSAFFLGLLGNAFSARLILRALACFVEKDVDGVVLVALLLAAAGDSRAAKDWLTGPSFFFNLKSCFLSRSSFFLSVRLVLDIVTLLFHVELFFFPLHFSDTIYSQKIFWVETWL